VNKAVTNIQVKYGPDITLVGVSFPISGWKLISRGIQVSGTGAELNGEAKKLMKASSGEIITLIVYYKKPDHTVSARSASFKVN
jgi:hypothetical protein